MDRHFVAWEVANAKLVHPYDAYDLQAPLDAPKYEELGYIEEMVFAGLPTAYVTKRRVFKLGEQVYIETTTAHPQSTSYETRIIDGQRKDVFVG